MLDQMIQGAKSVFPADVLAQPWLAVPLLEQLITARLAHLGGDFKVVDQVAIHRSAQIESGVVLKGPSIVEQNCFVASHSYLRTVYLHCEVCVGPSVEIKNSMIFEHSRLAHLNCVGDSLVGRDVNLEAGVVVANHFNERAHKEISVWIDGVAVPTGLEKFGAVIGDGARLGAHAVLSPGTLLPPESIVGRLELVDPSAVRG